MLLYVTGAACRVLRSSLHTLFRLYLLSSTVGWLHVVDYFDNFGSWVRILDTANVLCDNLYEDIASTIARPKFPIILPFQRIKLLQEQNPGNIPRLTAGQFITETQMKTGFQSEKSFDVYAFTDIYICTVKAHKQTIQILKLRHYESHIFLDSFF